MIVGYKKYGKDEITDERRMRIQEMAQLYNEGWSLEEIAGESGFSERTIERDFCLMKELGLICED